MIKRTLLLLVCVVILSSLFVWVSEAGLINYQRRNSRLGLRPDGTPYEEDEIWAKWMRELPRVRTRTERRYDINRDGILQTAEVKILLRDVIEEIDRRGGYEVFNSDVLKEYDKNRDGIISKNEVERIQLHAR